MSRVPWVALGALVSASGIGLVALLRPVSHLVPGCAFRQLTGIACATCGLTRCVLALGRWEWREAFHWHPAAAGVALLLPFLALWDLRRAWRGDPYPPLPQSQTARLGAWTFLLAVWVLQVARGI